MGRKQRERQKKKKNNRLLAASTSRSVATATASPGDAVGGNNSATADHNSDIDIDVGVAAVKKVMTTEKTTIATCYHGSTFENVVKGSHFQTAIDEYLSIMKNLAGKKTEFIIGLKNFNVKHEDLMNNPKFIDCVFAVATDMFLESYGSEEYHSYSYKVKLQDVLHLGIKSKYMYSPLSAYRENYDKYVRDIMTDRGIINVLFRETKNSCNCMKPYKEEAKAMEKLGTCMECDNEFPKQKLKLCSRCLSVQYCSKECMKNNWPIHKKYCTLHNKSEERYTKIN